VYSSDSLERKITPHERSRTCLRKQRHMAKLETDGDRLLARREQERPGDTIMRSFSCTGFTKHHSNSKHGQKRAISLVRRIAPSTHVLPPIDLQTAVPFVPAGCPSNCRPIRYFYRSPEQWLRRTVRYFSSCIGRLADLVGRKT
ncbi:unnamed protein product, partial [Scytosiphon promiscuus]